MDRPLSTPRTDPTAQTAIARVSRGERREPGLWLPISELCGDQLIEAYRRVRVGLAYYGRDAA